MSIKESGSLLTKREHSLLEKHYSKGQSSYGSIKNLVRTSGLSTAKVKAFLHSKDSYTRYYPTNSKFTRLNVNARFINDIWCADLAFVDKLSKENNNVKYLLVVVDVASRFVRVQPMKNKYASTTIEAFKKFKIFPRRLWVDKGTEFAGTFKTFCANKRIHIYHTNSETKAAFAERAIRSLKRILYRYMDEKQTYVYLPKLQQFVNTMNNRINRSIKKKLKDFKNSDIIFLFLKSL